MRAWVEADGRPRWPSGRGRWRRGRAGRSSVVVVAGGEQNRVSCRCRFAVGPRAIRAAGRRTASSRPGGKRRVILRLADTGRVADAAHVDQAIASYYERGREQDRLKTSGRLEFLRTQELLARFLPRPRAAVLDVGGGAGAHALPLIEAGYEVALVEPIKLHVEQARAAGVERADIGEARRLEFPDGSFDAVLLLGPLYHLTQRDDRLAALREAARVLRPGGIVLASAISRFASTYDGLLSGHLVDPEFEQIVESDLATGLHLNPRGRPGWFTTAYFHAPTELAAELEDGGFGVDALLAVEGPASLIANVDEWLGAEDRRTALMSAIRRVEAEPSILGASSHVLAIGRSSPGGEPDRPHQPTDRRAREGSPAGPAPAQHC